MYKNTLNSYVGRTATLREAFEGWPQGKQVTIVEDLALGLYKVKDSAGTVKTIGIKNLVLVDDTEEMPKVDVDTTILPVGTVVRVITTYPFNPFKAGDVARVEASMDSTHYRVTNGSQSTVFSTDDFKVLAGADYPDSDLWYFEPVAEPAEIDPIGKRVKILTAHPECNANVGDICTVVSQVDKLSKGTHYILENASGQPLKFLFRADDFEVLADADTPKPPKSELDLTHVQTLKDLHMVNGQLSDQTGMNVRVPGSVITDLLKRLNTLEAIHDVDPAALKPGDEVIYIGAPMTHPANSKVRVTKHTIGVISSVEPHIVFVRFPEVDGIAFAVEPYQLRLQGNDDRARHWNLQAAEKQYPEVFADDEVTELSNENGGLRMERDEARKKLEEANRRIKELETDAKDIQFAMINVGAKHISSSQMTEYQNKRGTFVTYFVPFDTPPKPEPQKMILGVDEVMTMHAVDPMLKSSDPVDREKAFQNAIATGDAATMQQAARMRIAAAAAHAIADQPKPSFNDVLGADIPTENKKTLGNALLATNPTRAAFLANAVAGQGVNNG